MNIIKLITLLIKELLTIPIILLIRYPQYILFIIMIVQILFLILSEIYLFGIICAIW
jgi:hypothetical protein